jgi:hypothetical protein
VGAYSLKPIAYSKIMKYKRLTKEQFEALHMEFANFLATQSIDKKEWDVIKAENRKLPSRNWMCFLI